MSSCCRMDGLSARTSNSNFDHGVHVSENEAEISCVNPSLAAFTEFEARIDSKLRELEAKLTRQLREEVGILHDKIRSSSELRAAGNSHPQSIIHNILPCTPKAEFKEKELPEPIVKFIEPRKNDGDIEKDLPSRGLLHGKTPVAEKGVAPGGVISELELALSTVVTLPQEVERIVDIKVDDLCEMSKSVDGDAFNFELDCSYDRAFEQSIWDGLTFWGLPGVNPIHTVFITLGFLTTILAQATFCWAILKGGTANSQFLSDPYPSLQQIEKWRIHSGHNVMMIDALTGDTLVKRVCNGDQSIPYSGSYQSVNQTFAAYLSDNVGIYLCCATLFVWILTIVQSLNPVLTGIFSLFFIDHHHTTVIGKATDPKYKFRMSHMTIQRAVAVFVLKLLHAAVMVVSGVTGGLWLANTKDLQNLILNTSALSFITSVDSLAYCVFLPKKLRTLIETAQPLKLPVRFFGGVIFTMLSFIFVLVSVGVFVFAHVLADNDGLSERQNALCGGNKEFVYSRHAATDTLYAASTRNAPQGIYKSHKASLKALIDSHSADLASMTVGIEPHYGTIGTIASMTMGEYTDAFMYYYPYCRDIDDSSNHAVTLRQFHYFFHTIREQTQINSSSCAAFSGHCHMENFTLLRLACPVTCGCSDPLSGLAYRVDSEGCPVGRCRQSAQYATILNNAECRDFTPAELQVSAAWNRFFDHLMDFEWMELKDDMEKLVLFMRQNGCAGIPYAFSSLLRFDFCAAQERGGNYPGIGSLRTFCPITCQCPDHLPWRSSDCPTTCYNQTTQQQIFLYRRDRISSEPSW